MNRALVSLEQDIRHPALRSMAAHWLALYQRGNGVPCLRDIDPLCFRAAIRDAWLIDAEADGEFRFRLAGETLAEWYGYTPKGRTLREICTPALFRVLDNNSRRMIDGPAILYHRMRSWMPEQSEPARFERIGLPLTDAEGQVRHLLGATCFDHPFYNGRGAVSTEAEFEYVYDLGPASHRTAA